MLDHDSSLQQSWKRHVHAWRKSAVARWSLPRVVTLLSFYFVSASSFLYLWITERIATYVGPEYPTDASDRLISSDWMVNPASTDGISWCRAATTQSWSVSLTLYSTCISRGTCLLAAVKPQLARDQAGEGQLWQEIYDRVLKNWTENRVGVGRLACRLRVGKTGRGARW